MAVNYVSLMLYQFISPVIEMVDSLNLMADLYSLYTECKSWFILFVEIS